MPKIKYLTGLLKHILNSRISKLALIANLSTIHRTSRICRRVKVDNSHVEAYTYIAPGTQLVYANIGKFSSIGPECLIGLPIHSLKNISTSPIFTSKNNATKYHWIDQNSIEEFRQVIIGNDVWIGSRTIVMGGVKIGHGAIIGAGSIVTRDIPNYAIAVGVPARVVKYRFDEAIIGKLLEIKWWNLSEQQLKDNIQVFNRVNFNIQDLEDIFDIK